jgi:SAM-dependent methyltransferase
MEKHLIKKPTGLENHELFPSGLENIPVPRSGQYSISQKDTRLFYVCERLFKKALISELRSHFTETHPDLAQGSFAFALRPEPTNLAYYYKTRDKERIVVLGSDSLHVDLREIFVHLLQSAFETNYNELVRICKNELHKLIFSGQLKKIELTMGQEKTYLKKIFDDRYKNQGISQKKAPGAIPKDVQNKMMELSFHKYYKASNLVLDQIGIDGDNKQIGIDNNLIDKGIIETLEKRLYKNKLDTILDCGCGTNGPAFFQRFEKISYTGLDLIDARSKQTPQNNLEIVKGDIENPPTTINKQKYSIVIGLNVLETTTRPWIALKQISKVITPNGFCLLGFNQYEGSLLYTGNPFSLESLIKYLPPSFRPLTGQIFIALDSPTKRDYMIVLKNESINASISKTVKAELEFCEEVKPIHGADFATIHFN